MKAIFEKYGEKEILPLFWKEIERKEDKPDKYTSSKKLPSRDSLKCKSKRYPEVLYKVLECIIDPFGILPSDTLLHIYAFFLMSFVSQDNILEYTIPLEQEQKELILEQKEVFYAMNNLCLYKSEKVKYFAEELCKHPAFIFTKRLIHRSQFSMIPK